MLLIVFVNTTVLLQKVIMYANTYIITLCNKNSCADVHH